MSSTLNRLTTTLRTPENFVLKMWTNFWIDSVNLMGDPILPILNALTCNNSSPLDKFT